ncbi:MAG: hypothetical protein ACM37W_16235 [Actinomycetota bacterium]
MQPQRPQIRVRKTRPSDGLIYERNEYYAYWIEEGDLEKFPDIPEDAINGAAGQTEEEAIARAECLLDKPWI